MSSRVSAVLAALGLLACTEGKVPAPPASASSQLASAVYEWERLVVEPRPNGSRRSVLDGPTATLDRLHVHISTLEPGQRSGEPSLHRQEEVIIVREGTSRRTSTASRAWRGLAP